MQRLTSPRQTLDVSTPPVGDALRNQAQQDTFGKLAQNTHRLKVDEGAFSQQVQDAFKKQTLDAFSKQTQDAFGKQAQDASNKQVQDAFSRQTLKAFNRQPQNSINQQLFTTSQQLTSFGQPMTTKNRHPQHPPHPPHQQQTSSAFNMQALEHAVRDVEETT